MHAQSPRPSRRAWLNLMLCAVLLAQLAFLPNSPGLSSAQAATSTTASSAALPEATPARSPSADEDKDPGGDIATDPWNDRIAVQLGSNGRFNMGAFPNPANGQSQSGSWNLIYAWPGGPSTSFSTLRIDGSDSIYGSSGTLIEAPRDLDRSTNRSSWRIGEVEVVQTLQIVLNPLSGHPDTAKIAYTIKNVGTRSHDVGLRVMLDTMLNGNDGAPFRVPEIGIVTAEREFLGAAIPDSFQAFFGLNDSQHLASAILRGEEATPPDRLVLADWRGIYGTAYDYPINTNRAITSDSAYAAYWNPQALAPGAQQTFVTYYGLGSLDVANGQLTLGLSGPALLSATDNHYTPNPFDIVATVRNTTSAAINNVQATLNLPAGLSLAGGSATQASGTLSAGQERQVSWMYARRSSPPRRR